MMAVAFIAVAAGASFAQDACEDYDGQAALYEKFNTAYSSKDLQVKKTSIDLGKQFLEKYGSCPSAEDTANWLKENLPAIEKSIKAAIDAEELKKLFAKFDNGVKAQNYADAFAAGKEILAKPNQGDNLNIIVPLGAIGLYESYKKNNAFNADSLRYAKMAIDKMNSGVTSNKYGVFQFEYGTKEKALSEMNYVIAYITYHVNNDHKNGIEAYYKVTQMPGDRKNEPAVYDTIGSYYFDEVVKLADKVKTLIAEQQALTSEEEKAAKDTEIKSTIALLNAYAERSMDSYGRARALVTKTDAESTKYKAALTERLTTLYDIRFEKKDGLDAYIANAIKKPLPDPTQPVEVPVETETPAAAPTPSGESSSAKPAAKSSASAEKP
jgi:hypothetical protein